MTMPTAGSRLLEFAQESGQYPAGSDNSDDGAECSESVGQMEDRDYQNALVVNVMRWLAYLNFSSLV